MAMEHNHVLLDDDPHFSIDPDARSIVYASADNLILVRGDHNSEMYTFEIPRLIDGHDLSKCTNIEVHYINIDSSNTDNRYSSFDDVKSYMVCDENTVSFSWAIPDTATQYVGTLSFSIRFSCYENGKTIYAWHTIPFTGVTVATNVNSYEDFTIRYDDIIREWHMQLISDVEDGTSKIVKLTNEVLDVIGKSGGVCVSEDQPTEPHINAWVRDNNEYNNVRLLEATDIATIPGTSDEKVMSQKIVSDIFEKSNLLKTKKEELTFKSGKAKVMLGETELISNFKAKLKLSTTRHKHIGMTIGDETYRTSVPFDNVYGGTYNFADGSLKNEYGIITFSSDQIWTARNCASSYPDKVRYTLNIDKYFEDIEYSDVAPGEIADAICSNSKLPVVSVDDTGGHNISDPGCHVGISMENILKTNSNTGGLYRSRAICVYLPETDDDGNAITYTTDLADARANPYKVYVSEYMAGTSLVYKLAEPTLTNIDPLIDVTIPSGNNVIESDSIDLLSFDRVSVFGFKNIIDRNIKGKHINQITDMSDMNELTVELTNEGVPVSDKKIMVVYGKNLCKHDTPEITGSNLEYTYDERNGEYHITNLDKLTTKTVLLISDARSNLYRFGPGKYTFSLGAELPAGITCSIVAHDAADLSKEKTRAVINSKSGDSVKLTLDKTMSVLLHIAVTFDPSKFEVNFDGNLVGIDNNECYLYPQLEFGGEATGYEAPYIEEHTSNSEGIVTFDPVSGYDVTILATDYNDMDVTYSAYTSDVIADIIDQVNDPDNGSQDKFNYKNFNIPVIEFTGNISAMSKDNAVDLTYVYTDNTKETSIKHEGDCTLKWQGSSSVKYPKKNYTFKSKDEITVVDSWGSQKKYCLKADWIDASHSRNVVAAKLWGDIVKTRANTTYSGYNIKNLPNCGAVDGFPCFVVINGEWQGIYNFNIPKDEWMFGMYSKSNNHAILCAENPTNIAGTNFKGEAEIGNENENLNNFAIESDNGDSSPFTPAAIKTSINNLITKCINAKSEADVNNLAQFIDLDSVIDYYIFAVLLRGIDIYSKNYILATYDGVKWFYSAYDLDCTFGLTWDGTKLLSAEYGFDDGADAVSFQRYSGINRLMELLYTYKKPAIKARYKEIRNGVLNPSRVFWRFSNHVANVPRTAFDAEVNLWKTIPCNNGNDANYIMNWYQERVKYVDKEVDDWNV